MSIDHVARSGMGHSSSRKKKAVLAAPARRGHLLAALAALVAPLWLSGCGGLRDRFLEGRALDRCDGSWPVCDRIVGCMLGDKSYVEGRFPGSGRVGVQVFEPSLVRVSFYLEEISAAGEETVIHFFEERCRARIREGIGGRSMVGEFEQRGVVSREAELTGVGDHLIEFESDAKARYLLKVDVVPTRLSSSQ